ncbi:hypothetical protein [Roseomonas indoligenes]|uniref:Uncharacterized protein n=1 Tax=Roseomonas indoligenes TaxID=2820811 RepID=A0A940S7C0_9PROT|nr:hypothetical protein [Pararoseomonas indoligenes]MBP0492898.1 hypothetical protein [Pararoseomonas indoligenes]
MLTLRPSPPPPLRADRDREELTRIWDSVGADERKVLIAHARAVVEMTGAGRRTEKRL